MSNSSPIMESKRVRGLRLELARAIPKFPNNRASLQALEKKSLGSILIDYANWMIRYVAPRPRKVIVEPSAFMDTRWTAMQSDIEELLYKVERGENLTPHLSIRPHTHGFSPKSSGVGLGVDRWADKDMLLNVMGYHHFHPGIVEEPQGCVGRNKYVLFAEVTRHQFTVIGVFDHSVFTSGAAAQLTPERDRLWRIFEERTSRNTAPNTVVVPMPIATSGHPVFLINLAMEYARHVKYLDNKLDDPTYILDIANEIPFSLPKRQKWKLHLYHLDLGLLEQTSDSFLAVRPGPN